MIIPGGIETVEPGVEVATSGSVIIPGGIETHGP